MSRPRRFGKGYHEKYPVYPQDIQIIAHAFDITSRSLADWRVDRVW